MAPCIMSTHQCAYDQVATNDWFFFIGTLAYWGIQFDKYCVIKNTYKIVLLYHAP